MRSAVTPVLIFTIVAGCMGDPVTEPAPVEDPCPRPPVIMTMPLTSHDPLAQRADPNQPYDFLVFFPTTTNASALVNPPPGWVGRVFPFQGNSTNQSLVQVRLENTLRPERGEYKLTWAASLKCHEPETAASAVASIPTPARGDAPGPGQGVDVWTAGFWENGTLFYTNIRAVDESPWPRADWYTFDDAGPLKVYVYAQQRTEKPAYWTACPPADNPLVQECAWNYYTTIEGFNAALKDMSTQTIRVVHIPPEKAYTQPGNEAKPLYGDAIVFWIAIDNVGSLPCHESVAQGPCAD